MVELIMAWVLLFTAIAKQEADWFIAAGVFAVATQIYQLRERK